MSPRMLIVTFIWLFETIFNFFILFSIYLFCYKFLPVGLEKIQSFPFNRGVEFSFWFNFFTHSSHMLIIVNFFCGVFIVSLCAVLLFSSIEGIWWMTRRLSSFVARI